MITRKEIKRKLTEPRKDVKRKIKPLPNLEPHGDMA